MESEKHLTFYLICSISQVLGHKQNELQNYQGVSSTELSVTGDPHWKEIQFTPKQDQCGLP